MQGSNPQLLAISARFFENKASDFGGAVYVAQGKVVDMLHASFEKNKCHGSGANTCCWRFCYGRDDL